MSYFRTLEVSNPSFERDGLRMITVKSPALGRRCDITLWMPEVTEQQSRLVILLHGVYGSHWAWTMQGGAHHTARELLTEGLFPAMPLAMPSDGLWGDGSGYLRHSGGDFETWIAEEVPLAVAEATGYRSEGIFLCGLSMGGFGAMRIGARMGRKCRGISAHSSITALDQMPAFILEAPFTYASNEQGEDLLPLMLSHKQTLPPLRFDCGSADALLAANRNLHAGFVREGIPHCYEELPGGHDWNYWRDHLALSLRFFANIR